MEIPHPLQCILQSYLTSDASALFYTPQILEQLSSYHLAPSSYLSNWYTRITSLMHSKDPGARWAGICLAYRTSALSEPLLIEYAQTWVGITLNLLSKPEPPPILRVSMRYLRLVLSAAANHPAFQRQIAAPFVPKFSAAVMSIAESSTVDTMTPAICTLRQLIMLYPSQHKVSSGKLSALCYRILGGSVPQPMDNRLVHATADLFATLHYLGGKVGGAHVWRSCLDTVLQSSWMVWVALRSTFPSSVTHWSGHCPWDNENANPLHLGPLPEDPSTMIALLLDRLKCCIITLCALLRAPVQRPVKLPVGGLVALCSAFLGCTDEEQNQSLFEPQIRALETAAIPQIWMYGCQLLSCICQTIQGLLVPTASQLTMIVACQLEKNQEASQRLGFLRAAHDLLRHCPVVGSQFSVTRLTRIVNTSLASLTISRSDGETTGTPRVQSKTSQKRRRELYNNNILTNQPVIRVTQEECDVVLVSLDVLDAALKNVELMPSVRSRSSQILLSLLLSLSAMPPQSLFHDPSFHGRLLGKVHEMCSENLSGTPVMSRTVGLVLRSSTANGRKSPVLHAKLQSYLDLLIHPRQPPLVRSSPFFESLSLAPTEDDSENVLSQRVLTFPSDHGTVEEKLPESLETAETIQYDQVPSKINAVLPHTSSPPRTKTPLSAPSTPDAPPDLPGTTVPIPSAAKPIMQVQLPQEKPSRLAAPTFTGSGPEDDDDELPTINIDSDSDSEG